MTDVEKLGAAVSAAIESRGLYQNSIAELLKPEFGKEEWFKSFEDTYNSVRIIVPDVVDNYYKSKANSSIEIVADESIKELFGEFTDNQIYKRMFHACSGLEKIKAAYVVNNNKNFARVLKTNDDMAIIAINKSAFQQRLFLALEYTSIIAAYNIISCISYENSRIVGKIKSIIGNSLMAQQPVFNSRGIRSLIQSTRVYNKLGEIEKTKILKLLDNGKYKAEMYGELIKMLLEISMTSISASEGITLSTLVNGVFDYQNKITKELNANSKVVKYESVNPISGFVSIKAKREKLEESALPQHEFDKLVKVHKEINKIYENASSIISEYKITCRKEKETILRIVSGEEIISLYEITSYYGYNRQEDDGGGSLMAQITTPGTPSNPLFNSCMRQTGNKNRISFYANNPSFVKMIAVISKGTGKLKARAIVWYDSDTKNHYVDRIFYVNEESKNEIISFIKSSDNFYSIYSNNGISGAKYKTGFLIRYKGAIEETVDIPYFDSLSHYLYENKDGNYFFGRGDHSGYKPISLALYRNGIVSPNFKGKSTSCSLCGAIGPNVVKFGETLSCKTHAEKDDNGNFYLRYNDKVIDPYNNKNLTDEEVRDNYTYNPISMLKRPGMFKIKNINIFKPSYSPVFPFQSEKEETSKYVYSVRKNNSGITFALSNINGATYYYDDSIKFKNLSEKIVISVPRDNNHPSNGVYKKIIKVLEAILDSKALSIPVNSVFSKTAERLREMVNQVIAESSENRGTNSLIKFTEKDFYIENPFSYGSSYNQFRYRINIDNVKFADERNNEESKEVTLPSMAVIFKTKEGRSFRVWIPIDMMYDGLMSSQKGKGGSKDA